MNKQNKWKCHCGCKCRCHYSQEFPLGHFLNCPDFLIKINKGDKALSSHSHPYSIGIDYAKEEDKQNQLQEKIEEAHEIRKRC